VQQAANRLFELSWSTRAANPARANRWLHEVLFLDPQHARAAQAVSESNAVAQTTRPRRREPTLGWNSDQYWEIRSANFLIVTNATPAAGEALAGQLELVYQLWSQLFFDQATTAAAWLDRVDGQSTRVRPRPRMRAVLFASRGEYLQFLAPSQPQIDVTLGYYVDRQRMAFYYVGDQPLETTWRHETIHQLFQERRTGSSKLSRTDGVCLVEGVAMYFESLRLHPGYVTLGGIDAERLQFARHRTLVEGFFVPLAELAQLSQESLQSHADIRAYYSLAAGWSHFWLSHPDPGYRAAYCAALDRLYSGLPLRDFLWKTLSQHAEQIDQQYQQYLRSSDELVAQACLAGDPSMLLLGRTAVTDAGLRFIHRPASLAVLDLRSTAVTDAGLINLGQMRQLREINLSRTQITDQTIERLAGLPLLEQVDVSDTPTTPEARSRLEALVEGRRRR
jgi:hypothetical protein